MLSDISDCLLLVNLNGLALITEKRRCHKCLNIRRLSVDDVCSDIIGKLLELVCICSEISLDVNLNKNACLHVIGNLRDYRTLCGNSRRLLLSLGHALLTKPCLGLLNITIARYKSFLAIHDAAISQLTEFLNLLCCNSHSKSS